MAAHKTMEMRMDMVITDAMRNRQIVLMAKEMGDVAVVTEEEKLVQKHGDIQIREDQADLRIFLVILNAKLILDIVLPKLQ